MTVDVENYFQVSAVERYIIRKDWRRLPPQVECNTDRVLVLFAEHGVKATFFRLGWIAERYLSLRRRMVDAGHELASHGYAPIRVTQQTPAEFYEDIRRRKLLLEDIGGVVVRGYRAASYSIGVINLWTRRYYNMPVMPTRLPTTAKLLAI